jgi:hypothetical protein
MSYRLDASLIPLDGKMMVAISSDMGSTRQQTNPQAISFSNHA